MFSHLEHAKPRMYLWGLLAHSLLVLGHLVARLGVGFAGFELLMFLKAGRYGLIESFCAVEVEGCANFIYKSCRGSSDNSEIKCRSNMQVIIASELM